MKKISILGSTGSIGTQTLQVIQTLPDQFEVVAMSCGYNLKLFKQQIQKFRPKCVSVADDKAAKDLQSEFSSLEVVIGEEGLKSVAIYPDADLVVSALVGAQGIRPTYEAIQAKKDIALANKEVLVSAGSLILSQVQKQGVQLLPIDSEHSALFQVFEEENRNNIEKMTLTASGGPFLHRSLATFGSITPEEALKHPQWEMGKRITIDSATLLNKGFEVIEAHWLFNLSPSQIEVVIHPQSIVHSLIGYRDGNTLACLSLPDMRVPIAYALSFPNRVPTEVQKMNLAKVKELTFLEPDFQKFPLLSLAYESLRKGEYYPCILNAADEVAVQAFLQKKISFLDIQRVIEQTLSAFGQTQDMTLEGVFEIDEWARRKALSFLA